MVACRGGAGALHAAAIGSPCMHTPTHPSPASLSTAPSRPDSLARSTRGHKELRGEMVELGAWRVRAAWHAAVPVPIAPVQPLHQPDLWLHPPPAQLQTAGIRHCCVQFLRAMVTLYSPMQPAAQCQLSMGCGAGKRAFHAWRQRQQAQLCPPCCRRPSTLTCPGWSSGNWLCDSPINHIQNPAETPG